MTEPFSLLPFELGLNTLLHILSFRDNRIASLRYHQYNRNNRQYKLGESQASFTASFNLFISHTNTPFIIGALISRKRKGLVMSPNLLVI